MSTTRKKLNPMLVSLADIEKALSLDHVRADFQKPSSSRRYSETPSGSRKPLTPYIKVTLRKTAPILLYEHRSLTACRDTEEGRQVEADNERYALLTEGPLNARPRTKNSGSQTAVVLLKTREVNTECIRSEHVGCYVSNFEMFDTYRDLETSTKSIDVGDQQKIEVTTYKVGGVDAFADIGKQPSFELALMLTMRILAGNVFEQQQRRFRNLRMPDPLAAEVLYHYRLQLLWRFQPERLRDGNCRRRAVTDFSWCPRNSDILAVAYGLFTFPDVNQPPDDGCVCVWSIKNPINAERRYSYKVPVMTVEFSPFVPCLLAVGLYDGTIEVLNISNTAALPVAVTDRKTLRNAEPVIDIKWIAHDADNAEQLKPEPFLALTRDSCVKRYRITSSPYLLAQLLLLLDRVEARPEGVPMQPKRDLLQASRRPQGLSLCLHPTQPELYYVLTDEGCRYTCSTNYPMQHLEVLQAHVAGANAMHFSPWSPRLFLTCGNDWCVHIWMEGILEPIISLRHSLQPVYCAGWSSTHSTIVVSLNRTTVDVWDLRRSTLKPVSSTNVDVDFHTVFAFSKCGRSIAVGNEAGNVLMLAFEDMPFPPHYQYEQLEKAIYNAVSNNSELTKKVKSLGYFGYPEHRRRKAKKLNKKRSD